MKTVCICGSDPRTRDLIPWKDASKEFWVLNEAASRPTPIGAHGKTLSAEEIALSVKPVRLDPPWPKRVDAVFQMHSPAIYTSTKNLSDPNHWVWLQEPHPFPIYMQGADERVPASVRYPLEEVTAMIRNIQLRGNPLIYFTSSMAYAMGLAVYRGFDAIELYGVELDSGTEYEYQRACMLFWIGLAGGRGIDVRLFSGEGMFERLLYGYEGDLETIGGDLLNERKDVLVREFERLAKRADHANKAVEGAIKARKHADIDLLISEAEQAYLDWGVAAGALGEVDRYLEKVKAMEAETGGAILARQEFELAAAQAQHAMELQKVLVHRVAGKAEYVWYFWRQDLENKDAIAQLKMFIKEQMTHAYRVGAYQGIITENVRYMTATDERIRMAGGQKAMEAAGVMG